MGWNLVPTRQTFLKPELLDETEMFFQGVTALKPGELEGKLVLDVGTGDGKYTHFARKYGAEVVGVDLSYAVNAAFETMGKEAGIHFVQGDVFHLPFEEGSFDFIFSISTLHHTPNCEAAFKSLPPLLKLGGKIAICVYACYNLPAFSNGLRLITKRLPKPLLYRFCYLPSLLYYPATLPLLRSIFHALRSYIYISLHPDWEDRILGNFDWYSPEYTSYHTHYEVFKWFKDCGLKDIEIGSKCISMIGTRPRE